jgi:CheY-like chemotaxis protein
VFKKDKLGLKPLKVKTQTSLKILIAEDNQFTASQYDKILRKYGHNVVITRDGAECLKKYQESLKKSEFEALDANPFDVVVLDQSMPKKSGSEVATEILTVKPTQKIVFASAYALTGSQSTKTLEDKVEYLQKPFSLNTFVQKIQGD